MLQLQPKKPAIKGFQKFGLNKLFVPKGRVLPFPTVFAVCDSDMDVMLSSVAA